MPQLLLFPDPKPLVERLGVQFFREAPETAGVYLMRDRADTVLYVGKAKNLRQRLGSYRVANPERLRRRQLRLLRAVARIEFERCLDEADALDRESQLLRSLKPRFNRAGTWSPEPKFLIWQFSTDRVEFGVTTAISPGWTFHGPLGTSAFALRSALLRVLWSALHPELSLAALPHGWFQAPRLPWITLTMAGVPAEMQHGARRCLMNLPTEGPESLLEWVLAQSTEELSAFDAAAREGDFEVIRQYGSRRFPAETQPDEVV